MIWFHRLSCISPYIRRRQPHHRRLHHDNNKATLCILNIVLLVFFRNSRRQNVAVFLSTVFYVWKTSLFNSEVPHWAGSNVIWRDSWWSLVVTRRPRQMPQQKWDTCVSMKCILEQSVLMKNTFFLEIYVISWLECGHSALTIMFTDKYILRNCLLIVLCQQISDNLLFGTCYYLN